MTVEEAEAFLRRFTYKPGCTFGLNYTDGVVCGVQLTASDIPDANGGGTVTLGFSIMSDEWSIALWKEYDLIQTVKRACAFFERHEGEEWLKLDGKHVTDPHPELKAKT